MPLNFIDSDTIRAPCHVV